MQQTQLEKKLQVHNLRISFRTVSGKVQAVRDISFDLHKGETLAIVGESGSGKSVTSKAILGILAGNSIIEGGEILYDGQDLLKIHEDDFYRLRGDKIAMIFQDPLSSLNPIMRIGKQLTEAMLLKGKARQRSSKENFHEKLNLLEAYMRDASPDKEALIKDKCAIFRRFEVKHTQLEQAYNNALDAAKEALDQVEDLLFKIEKKALKDVSARFKQVGDFALRANNSYLVSEDMETLRALCAKLKGEDARAIKGGDHAPAQDTLGRIAQILNTAVQKPHPDFFAYGYAMETGAQSLLSGDIVKSNERAEEHLRKEFLDEFVELAQKGIEHADTRYAVLRATAVQALKQGVLDLKAAFAQGEDKAAEGIKAVIAKTTEAVSASINKIDIVKDSAACTFRGSMESFYNQYMNGIRTNAKKLARYNKQTARFERLEAKGKKPDWTVAPPSVVDFELVYQNIVALMNNLIAHYEQLAKQEPFSNKHQKTLRLIEYLKENASGMVLEITKFAAKNKAIKLMEEVGIPEPRQRYRQYPFEFSGGMRQRIVIAIALAANPDILICDEPTTALDVTIQAQILELINKLKAERDLSIIFITHDLGVVANMADRIAVMYAGKLVEYGTSEEVFYESAHPYTWALLSSMPDLDTKEKLAAIPGTPPNMIYPPKGDAFAERNQYAMQIDFEREPPKFHLSDTHWAATWLLHKDAPKVTPPKAVVDRAAKWKAEKGESADA